MEYVVKFTPECEQWFLSLTVGEKDSVMTGIELLGTLGPQLGYPYSTKILGSRYSQMRELRIQHKGHPYRILYVFDPERAAILLLGGDKIGDDRWYRKKVPIAEKRYDKYLAAMKR